MIAVHKHQGLSQIMNLKTFMCYFPHPASRLDYADYLSCARQPVVLPCHYHCIVQTQEGNIPVFVQLVVFSCWKLRQPLAALQSSPPPLSPTFQLHSPHLQAPHAGS